jgi:hypothetical protein
MTRTLAALLMLVAAPALTARAYTLDARTVLRRAGEHHRAESSASASFDGRIRYAADGKELSLTLDFPAPGQCRLATGGPEASEVTFSAGKVTEEGPRQPALAALASLACPLWLTRTQGGASLDAALTKVATQNAVDLGTISLSRQGRRPVFVLGARPREFHKAQLRVDKERYRPVGLAAKVGGEVWDVRILDGAGPTQPRASRSVELWRIENRQPVKVLALQLVSKQATGVIDSTEALELDDESD